MKKNNITNRLISEILDIAEKWYQQAMRQGDPSLSEDELKRAYQVSATACAQPTTVPVTPWMRHLLKKKDNFQEGRLLVCGAPETHAETFLTKYTTACLEAMDMKGDGTYDRSLPVFAYEHYKVDCIRNFKKGTEARQIGPDQYKQRRDTVEYYLEPLDFKEIKERIQRDPVLQKSIEVVYQHMPSVAADTTFKQVSEAFQKKFTNVGRLTKEIIGWFNARGKAPNGQTYAEVAMDCALKIRTPEDVFYYNVCTALGRNQRQKGRLLIAPSRPLNIWLDRLERVEIERLKANVAYFGGYHAPHVLKTYMVSIGEFCERHDMVCENMDQAGWDRHTGLWPLIVGAMRYLKCKGGLAKELCKYRAMTVVKSHLIDGMRHQVLPIYGRVFSGILDTNQVDGWIEAIFVFYGLTRTWEGSE